MSVLKSRKFWYAMVGLVLNIVAWLVPDIPTEVRASMSTVLTALVGALIAGHAYSDGQAMKMKGAEALADAIKEAGKTGVDPSQPSQE